MGGRANPLRDAAAIVAIGLAELADDLAADRNLRWRTGIRPTNTSGGCLSDAHVRRLPFVAGGVRRRQRRGTSTSRVAGARTCLVSPGEGGRPGALVLRAA